MDLKGAIDGMAQSGVSVWGWENFLPNVKTLGQAVGAAHVIEIGGGRYPSFEQAEIADLGWDYTSNDISQGELDRSPPWVAKALFDIQTPDQSVLAPFRDRYDLAFSKMVMEHVPSYKRAYANIHQILAPGGIAVAFHPVLFASPFVLNYVLPEQMARSILQAFFKRRNDEQKPKFPAYYSGCRVSPGVRKAISDIGFSDVWQIPFWGHDYYKGLGPLHSVQKSAASALRRLDIQAMSAYCMTIARK